MFPFFLALLPIFYTLYFLIAQFSHSSFIKDKSKILIVTAHPDDEWRFYNKSSVRKEELRQSCKTLGIPAGNLIISEHRQLPDNPTIKWSRLKTSSIILKYIRHLSATIVISFDETGISGHLNHIAVCESLQYLSIKGQLPEDCEVFLLKTVFLLQKYLGFLLVPLLYVCTNFCFVSTFHDVKTTWKSMKNHKSQFVWFRKLYIIFSQYQNARL
ncbi:n-acetylglucosaminyl-phosphatidylinositol de-N-acetylase [Caerostris darwini]|uniref:N-acetylglucosaminylphosphatidylinositol deacetylase n=1 Tax=Caerostris darwini TaxID=1538125 RepID=A0AAV4X1K3_9ARAC|nr:n-acetylglucosaminyl-phosphatidylinositol de-N-acetylase [Caerostris darwini]